DRAGRRLCVYGYRGDRALVSLLLERRIEEVVDRGHRLVARHEALAEIAREVVIRRVGPGLDDPAGGAGELALQAEPGDPIDDRSHLRPAQGLVPEPGPVERDARRAQRHLALLVEGDGGGRVERDAVPDQLRAAIIDSFLSRERARGVSPFDFE